MRNKPVSAAQCERVTPVFAGDNSRCIFLRDPSPRGSQRLLRSKEIRPKQHPFFAVFYDEIFFPGPRKCHFASLKGQLMDVKERITK